MKTRWLKELTELKKRILLKKKTIKNTELAQKMVNNAVYIYNHLRTHFSLGLRKPFEVHNNPNINYKSYRKNNVNLLELKI